MHCRNENKRTFYLHLPERSNSQKQAIEPIDGTKTLQDVLRGRTVREFPTIIVAVPVIDEVEAQMYSIVAPSLVELESTQSAELEAAETSSPLRKRKAEALEDGEPGPESEEDGDGDGEEVVNPQQLGDAVAAAKSDLAQIAAVLAQNG